MGIEKENPVAVKPDDNTTTSVAQLTSDDAVMIYMVLTNEKAKRGIA